MLFDENNALCDLPINLDPQISRAVFATKLTCVSYTKATKIGYLLF